MSYSYKSSEKRLVVVGRNRKHCDIVFDDRRLSKHHSTIRYLGGSLGWTIQDGRGARASTNGTWRLVKGEFELAGQMEIIFENYLLKAVIQ